MKYLWLLYFPFLYGCSYVPDISKTIDDIATDDAIEIKVKIDKDAIQSDAEINIDLDIEITSAKFIRSR